MTKTMEMQLSRALQQLPHAGLRNVGCGKLREGRGGGGGRDDIVIAFRLSCRATTICLCAITCPGSFSSFIINVYIYEIDGKRESASVEW